MVNPPIQLRPLTADDQQRLRRRLDILRAIVDGGEAAYFFDTREAGRLDGHDAQLMMSHFVVTDATWMRYFRVAGAEQAR